MKKIFIIPLLFLGLSLEAQSDAEVRILNELNSYRSNLDLPKVLYSKELSNAARYHAKYLSICTKRDMWLSEHDEKYDFQEWKELNFAERCAKISEESNGFEMFAEIQIQGGGDDEKMIINSFHNSIRHRDIMRLKKDKILYVGIGNIDGNTVIDFGDKN